MTMMMLRSASLLLILLPSLTTAFGPPWWANETVTTYANWPSEVVSILEEEKQTYQSDSFPGLPTVRVFQAFPEYEPRVWPLMKGISWRMNPLLWPHVHYYMEGGLEYGCRTLQDKKQVPVDSAHCHRHCIHGGRYCVPQKFEVDTNGPQGKDALKEMSRRLCLDSIFHAKDKRFIAYLEGFDHENCFQADHIRNCSLNVMNSVGAEWSKIEACVDESNWSADIENPILERNLKHVHKPHNFTIADMPMITIDAKPVPGNADGMLDTNTIFHTYCQAFPEHYERPFACDACEGCQDTRTCLWTLECDGEPFDMAIFLDDGKTDPVDLPHATVTPEIHTKPATDAPKKTQPPKQKDDATPEDHSYANAANSDTTATNQDAVQHEAASWVVFVCLFFLAALTCPVAYYIYRERRTKALMEEIKAGKYASEFRDQSGYKDKELGGRQKDEEEAYVDVVVDSVTSNDITVEDLMDDESEWAENKRVNPSALPEIS